MTKKKSKGFSKYIKDSLGLDVSDKDIEFQLLSKANSFIKSGNFKKAEEIYRDLISREMGSYIAYSQLGAILLINSSYDDALENLLKANALNPKDINTLTNLAKAYRIKGQIDLAIVTYQKILKINPNDFKALDLLGVIYLDKKDYSASINYLKNSLLINKDYFNSNFNFALANQQIGNWGIALKYYENVLQIDPKCHLAYYNLGEAYNNIGEVNKSISSYEKCINLKPDFFSAYLNLGVIYNNQMDIDKAINVFKSAMEINPNFSEVYYNLGNSYEKKEDLDKAVFFLRKAIKINPVFVQALHNLSCIYQKMGNLDNALEILNKVLSIDSSHKISLAQKLKIEREICNWDSFNYVHNLYKKGEIINLEIQPRDMMYLIDDPSVDLKVSKQLFLSKYKRKQLRLKPLKKKKINIGYFSADFRIHPVSILLARILELHNRDEFIIYAYSFGPQKNDDMNLRIKKSVDHFKDVSLLNDNDLVEMVHGDKIDIAVDLMGYTGNARPSLFSYRLAPKQINYLGYSGTMGHESIDYIIADEKLIPINDKKFYSEKVIYMKNTAICCDDTLKLIRSRKKDNGLKRTLPDNAFIFACFNNNFKISPDEFNIWMNLLKKNKNSYLWLKFSNDTSKFNLIKEADLRGVSSDKLIFAENVDFEEHIIRHSEADLFLDTFNYNAGSTAVISLISGLPILTIYGNSYHSRMSSSLLLSLGLDELVVFNKDEYQEKALYFSNHPKEIMQIKNKLNCLLENSDVFNSLSFVKELEANFKSLVRKIY